MPEFSPPTHFAPPERLPLDAVRRQHEALVSAGVLAALLDACPCIAVALNQERQIVYCNQALLDFVGVDDVWRLLGRRPGEAVGCVHACEMPGGCGTGEACQYCGAVLAVLDGLAGRQGTRECRITIAAKGHSEPLDLEVRVVPVRVGEERFVAVSMLDISHEKRRRALERIFFHDVLNTAGCVQGLADVMAEREPAGSSPRLVDTLRAATRQLVGEITGQRTLIAAESNDLAVDPELVGTLAVIRDRAQTWAGLPMARNRRIEIDPGALDTTMVTDPRLLGRVLENMLKNALEASRPGQNVRIGCRAAGDQIEFWVANEAVMPPAVQLQIFQRSFSTKGNGRGLGAYSMKLLTERYLGGSVSFSSVPGQGTEFRARYPRVLP